MGSFTICGTNIKKSLIDNLESFSRGRDREDS